MLFVLVRGRNGTVPKQTQIFSIPCTGRDEKVIDHRNSGFLCDSPPAIWPSLLPRREKPSGIGLHANVGIILSSPSVPYLFPELQVEFVGQTPACSSPLFILIRPGPAGSSCGPEEPSSGNSLCR